MVERSVKTYCCQFSKHIRGLLLNRGGGTTARTLVAGLEEVCHGHSQSQCVRTLYRTRCMHIIVVYQILLHCKGKYNNSIFKKFKIYLMLVA
jgi:hypothetical protein